MTKCCPAIVLSTSVTDIEEDAALMIAKIVHSLIETKLLEDEILILGIGEGLNVNIPTVTGSSTVVNDYQFKLTTIGGRNPFRGAQYFRDLKDSNANALIFGGAYDGFSGLGFTLPYTAAGYPADIDTHTECKVYGDLFSAPKTVVTVSPIFWHVSPLVFPTLS